MTKTQSPKSIKTQTPFDHFPSLSAPAGSLLGSHFLEKRRRIIPTSGKREGKISMFRNARALLRFSISRSASKQAALPRAFNALSGYAQHLFDEIPHIQIRSRSPVYQIQGRLLSSNGEAPFDYSKEVSSMLLFFSVLLGSVNL